VSSPHPAPAPVGPSLEELARVEAPPYVPGRLRGSDMAATTFQDAMRRYQQRDYPAAIARLREASALDPAAPHVAFFLGVSNLLAGRTDEAIDGLRATIALGDSPYLEEARFYLAKTYVKAGRVDDAIPELEQTIGLRGEHQAEARLLLGQLQVFKTTPR
jgi:tetratricopeptide (TPR) repeat protein